MEFINSPDCSFVSDENSCYTTPQSTPCKLPANISGFAELVLVDSKMHSLEDRFATFSSEHDTLRSNSSCTLVSHEIANSVDDENDSRSTNPFIDLPREYNENRRFDHLSGRTPELMQMEALEKQIAMLTIQLKLIQENICRLNENWNEILTWKSESILPKNRCDAQTQTPYEFTLPVAQNNVKKNTTNDFAHSSNIEIEVTNDSNKLTEEIKYKFRKLPALVKGYLVRRLLQTERVQQLKRTIADTSRILMQFKSNLLREGQLVVTHQDILFHQRLCIQLEKSCLQFYSIFFASTIEKQMDMIAKHREYLKSIVYLNEKRPGLALSQSSRSNSNRSLPPDRLPLLMQRLSAATIN